VFDPASTFDLMSYAGPKWMSPYNYARLMHAGGGPADGSSASLAARELSVQGAISPKRQPPSDEFNPVPMEYLHLRLTIHRNRKVERDHSFHFAAMRGSSCGHATEYVAEIVDSEGRTLICVPLNCTCNLCQAECYPVIVRSRIPMPPNAGMLRVWEGRDKMIYEEQIPDPPQIQWKSKSKSPEGMSLKWEAKSGPAGQEVRYLVQFEDRPGVWRGIMPRSQDPKLVIPWDFFKRRNQLHVRVLASSGIATGSIDDWIALEKPAENTPPVTPPEQPPIVVSPYGLLAPGKEVGAYLRAVSEPGASARWYDDAGAELSGSPTLDVRLLPDGQHHVRAVTTGGGGLQSASSLFVEKEGHRVTLLRDFNTSTADDQHVHPHTASESKNITKEKKS
jgi:hypothetical protein